MKENKKTHTVCVRISNEDNRMISALKDKHCMNISKLVRKFIRDIYMEFESNDKNI